MCADQGDWKLSWGKVGEDRYIADIDYDKARCLALLPPTTADADGGAAEAAEGSQLPPWQHPGDADLASAEPDPAEPDPEPSVDPEPSLQNRSEGFPNGIFAPCT